LAAPVSGVWSGVSFMVAVMLGRVRSVKQVLAGMALYLAQSGTRA
jgi:hypothetical protein